MSTLKKDLPSPEFLQYLTHSRAEVDTALTSFSVQRDLSEIEALKRLQEIMFAFSEVSLVNNENLDYEEEHHTRGDIIEAWFAIPWFAAFVDWLELLQKTLEAIADEGGFETKHKAESDSLVPATERTAAQERLRERSRSHYEEVQKKGVRAMLIDQTLLRSNLYNSELLRVKGKTDERKLQEYKETWKRLIMIFAIVVHPTVE